MPAGVSGPFKSNVLSHEVKFEIVSSGNATPGWKLKQVTVNQSGNLFSISRDRIQDLIVTFGPADPAWTIDPVKRPSQILYILFVPEKPKRLTLPDDAKVITAKEVIEALS